jgi:glucose-6-phosphate isomerase
MVQLKLFHDRSGSEGHYRKFAQDEVLAKLKLLDARAERKGLSSLDPKKNKLIPLGMEIGGNGRVTKNSYGLFHLSWKAEKDGDWHTRVESELAEIREAIHKRHGAKLRFVIWCGMGGSAEDKSAYNGLGLLKRGPRLYVLDSTDPAKLKAILADMKRRSGLTMPEMLKSTLVVGMAMGMTSYEPVINLEKLYDLYTKHKVDSQPNFIYMTMTGSLLYQFASPRGYRRMELQLDNGNATAGRHTGPLTRGSLYPLGLAGIDLKEWIAGTFLTQEEIILAFRFASFLHAQGVAGRDKVTLLLPRELEGIGLWTKQNFEESLGKSEEIGIKIVIGEKPKLANYRAPRDARQDRVFAAVQLSGSREYPADKVAALKRAGYPVAVVTLDRGTPVSAYMQWIHYAVFGAGYLRNMNFVTQPSVELYKAITQRIAKPAAKKAAWQRLKDPAVSVRYRGGVSIHFPHCKKWVDAQPKGSATEVYASLIRSLLAAGAIDTAELTFFGDTRYSEAGKKVRRVLDRAADRVFRAKLKMPVDVYEGPAMNHSYHEMIIGHGKCLSTVLLSEDAGEIREIGYTADYHETQFLATQMALADRGRAVVAILVKDLSDSALATLDEFFGQTAARLKA